MYALLSTFSVRTRKEAKCAAIAEAISTAVARTQELEKKIQGQRARKDEYAALISQQLLSNFLPINLLSLKFLYEGLKTLMGLFALL